MRYFLQSVVLILTLLVIIPLAVQSADSPFYWEIIKVVVEAQESGTQQKAAIEKSGEIFAGILFLLIISALVFFLFIVITGRHRRGPGMPDSGFVIGGGCGGGCGGFSGGGGGFGGGGASGGGCGGGCGGG